MSFERLDGEQPDFETCNMGEKVVFSMEAPDLAEPEDWLAVASVKAQLKSEVDEDKPRKPSSYSTNTSKGDVSFDPISRKGRNNAWWDLPCEGDGDPRRVCSLKGDRCTDWRR